jgi:hypothetical protein
LHIIVFVKPLKRTQWLKKEKVNIKRISDLNLKNAPYSKILPVQKMMDTVGVVKNFNPD